MSDEFNVENRTFKDGHDPMWTALDKSDDDSSSAGGGSMQFYNSSSVTTENGMLKISTRLGTTEWNHYDHVNKMWKHVKTNFTSGMVQSWDKFCFTGGIVEVDVVFPGDPYIGGLWPAVWMLGNLGRATYEASTNNIWPWSYNICNEELQPAQTLSACNRINHFGMHPFQGRGATEIDIAEVMTGYSSKPLPGTDPPIKYPYTDLTLQVSTAKTLIKVVADVDVYLHLCFSFQVAPGVKNNRPQTGAAPLRKSIVAPNGQTQFVKQTWYEGLEMHGNTSINPFFYGTYLDETQPNEPVTRTKKQAFQADAVGVAHQITPSHFRKPHTFRIEWQPGPGGRIDWFVKGYRVNATTMIEGDGGGKEWTHAFSLKDKSIHDLMGSQIPIEPSYLIFNVAVSSTWGFPYDAPDWCPKCYDCDDPKCACSFYPGFCQMLRSNKTAMYIDHIRVYQSNDPSVHVGANHTLGCDPPDYPTKEWINGHSYRYMRNPPFSYEDKHPLRQVQHGGAACDSDSDCGGDVKKANLTAVYEQGGDVAESDRQLDNAEGRGKCVVGLAGVFAQPSASGKVCRCNPGFTGPRCMALAYFEEAPSAYKIRSKISPFSRIHYLQLTGFMQGILVVLSALLVSLLVVRVREKNNTSLSKSVFNGPKKVSNDRSGIAMISGTDI